ncbi:PAC2 family protein [Anatilimnocola aggregata]|uniref:PAC2 family protein n=1 Tax=Anatilimnocola aggregata TaxID=2528021 RepID=A0A517YKE3_9BACT|nr:PAC2 family protein [Anatilimnocola aggregata]QDU30676.1 PAC2 family protein [Anatilimnocola aggregata]
MATEESKLHNPRLVAVWPGMGHVAISAGYYLMAKLHMDLFTEVAAQDLFDIDAVEIKDVILQAGRFPRSRFFIWHDPNQKHDLIVFIGEAQPPLGKFHFCRSLIELAKGWGVERVLTFAAMATEVGLKERACVFCTASNQGLLESLKPHGLAVLTQGQISGLNGVLLAAAVEAGIEGACLLGEMPHIFAQLPFPKASLAVLQAFEKISGVKIDLGEMERQAEMMNMKLTDLLKHVERENGEDELGEPGGYEEGEFETIPAEEDRLSPVDRERIETLFTESAADRSKAYELKRELDRVGVFAEYEDRFLDLFKKKS